MTEQWRDLSQNAKEVGESIEIKKQRLLRIQDMGQDDEALRESLAVTNRQYVEMSNELEALSSKIESDMGPVQAELYSALDRLGVSKTMYHGGTFVGNHIKTILDNKELLCSCLKDRSRKYSEILELWTRFSDIFPLLTSPRFLSEWEIEFFQQNCYALGEYYSSHFPERNISRKLHILVCHVPQFVGRWKTIGLFSEQKLESLHCTANRFDKQFSSIRDKKRKLTLINDSCNLLYTADKDLTEAKRRKCSEPQCDGYLKKQTGLDIRMCKQCGKIYP